MTILFTGSSVILFFGLFIGSSSTLSNTLLSICVTTAGINVSLVNLSRPNQGQIPDMENPLIMLLGVAALTNALHDIKGTSYAFIFFLGLFSIQANILWFIN